MRAKKLLVWVSAISIALGTAPEMRAQDLADAHQELERLVQEEKYEQALEKVDALLEERSDDAELQELRRQVQAAMSIKTAADAAAKRLVALSGEERLELDTVELVVEELQSTTDAKDRTRLAEEVLQRTGKLTARHPKLMQAWAYRAAAALELDRHREGWEAAKTLKALGAMDVDDEAMRRLMASLNRKRWLAEQYEEMERVTKAKANAEAETRQQQDIADRHAERRRREVEELQPVLGTYEFGPDYLMPSGKFKGSIRLWVAEGELLIEGEASGFASDNSKPATRMSAQVKVPRQHIQLRRHVDRDAFVAGSATGSFYVLWDLPPGEVDVKKTVEKVTVEVWPQTDGSTVLFFDRLEDVGWRLQKIDQ